MRGWLLAALLLLAVPLIAASSGEQYGAAAWRILKSMGASSCAPGSLCLWGGGHYYASTIADAQTALDSGCGAGILGSTPTGCRVSLTGGVVGNGGVTLHLAGDGTSATGRSGVMLECTGGGTAAGTGGNPISGTVLKSEGAVPVIDVGVCQGCVIQDCTIAGEDSATVGIDFLDPANSDPTTRFIIRNVAMYEINGYGIRTATGGQVDTMHFENVSVRDSLGCYQQRHTQNVGVTLTHFDCSAASSGTGPMYDIQTGEFTLRDSYLGIKNNEVGIRLGTPVGRALIDGNQLEMGSSTSGVMFDFNEGTGTTVSVITVSNNHIVFSENGNTLVDAMRRGTLSFENNLIQNINSGGDKTITSTIAADTNDTTNNRLFLKLSGNVAPNTSAGDAQKPERWIPTLSAGPPAITLLLPLVSAPDVAKVSPCIDGEVFNDSDAASGTGIAAFQRCVGGVWVAP